ncbi:bifunctional diaminohydroxyphosphoribosylaminopyrimidine deaminase/5-amino-6-(5-phosphoribosylamino)uracil reductase RibD [Peptostreptococcaceae bacterium AGR-M142]
MNHENIMKEVFLLAKKGIGKVNPNPLVGAILIKDGEMIGKGYHKEYKKEHAEENAIKDAIKRGNEKKIKDSSIYVNLEPCSHFGNRPPCVHLIKKYEIKKVYISNIDQNELVNKRGIEFLKENNIEVHTGILEEEGKKLNEIHNYFIRNKKPFVVLKSAFSVDGKIQTYKNDSKWISNELSRKKVHKYRNLYMGILTTANTIKIDNPYLNVRHVKKIRNPIKIILDPKDEINKDYNIFKEGKNIIIKPFNNKVNNIKNTKIINMELIDNKFDLNKVLKKLGELKIDSIMVEAGGSLIWNLIEQNLINKYLFFIAPKIIGGEDSKTFVEGSGFLKVDNALNLDFEKISNLNGDLFIEAYNKII